MTNRMSQYNPSFMNPMLESAQALLTRLHRVFGNGEGGSTTFTPEEAQALRAKHPAELGQMTVDQITRNPVMLFNRLYDNLKPSDSKFQEVISGQRIELTEQGRAELEYQGVQDLKNWLREEHGFTEDKLQQINFSNLFGSLKTLATESGSQDIEGFARKGVDTFYGPFLSAHYTPENSRTIHLSPEERHKTAKGETQMLFWVSCVFVDPGTNYVAALIDARDPQLARDMKDFFRTFAQQLNQLRNPEKMPDDIFAKLTA